MKLTTVMALVVLCAVVVPTAIAGKKHPPRKYKSTVTIESDTTGSAAFLRGAVLSGKPGCRSGRTLQILRDEFYTGDFRPYVSGVRTTKQGRWGYEPPSPIPNGYYKAVAAKKPIHAGVCRSAASPRAYYD